MNFSNASELFDLYIDWNRRLGREIPYLKSWLSAIGASRVADAACGCGMHAVALAREGFEVTALDPDAALLEKARLEAEEAEARITFFQSAFADPPHEVSQTFEAVISMGNSISLVTPGRAIEEAVSGLSNLLMPGGSLLLHTLNYPMLERRTRDPWGPVRSLDNGALVMKGFIPRPEGPWDALLILLRKEEPKGWLREVVRFQLHPHGRADLQEAGKKAGLILDAVHGGFAEEDPGQQDSNDLLYRFHREL